MTALEAKPLWVQADGSLVSCREKLKTLDENWAEARTVLQDAYDDALLMGVDEPALRDALLALVQGLRSPLRP